jgi:hypothetical protein
VLPVATHGHDPSGSKKSLHFLELNEEWEMPHMCSLKDKSKLIIYVINNVNPKAQLDGRSWTSCLLPLSQQVKKFSHNKRTITCVSIAPRAQQLARLVYGAFVLKFLKRAH